MDYNLVFLYDAKSATDFLFSISQNHYHPPMPFIDYKAKPKLKIWDGIYGQVQHSNQMTHAHISIAAGVALPEHHHVHEQWSHLLEGEMEFIVGGEKRHMKPGETAYIPGNVPHSGRTLTECKLIDVFSPVREDWIELEKKQLG